MKNNKIKTKTFILLVIELLLTSACGSVQQTMTSTTTATATTATATTMTTAETDSDRLCHEAIVEALEYFKAQRESCTLSTEEYTPTEEVVEGFLKVISMQPTRPKRKYEGDVVELLQIIKDNTAAGTPKTGTDIFQSEYTEMAEAALLQALQSWMDTATNASYDDYLTIRDASVYVEEGWGGNMATTDMSKRRVTIYIDVIKNYAKLNNISVEEYLNYNFMHELNHLRATLSTEEKQAGKSIYSFSYDSGVNFFITESSAESELYANGRWANKSYTYPDEREAEAEMMLFALLSDRVEAEDYYNAVFDNDLGGLFGFLGFHSMDDLRELYRFWYTTDAVLERNTYAQETYETPPYISVLRRDIGSAYKERFFLFFVEKLLAYTKNHNTFSWEDNLLFYQMASIAALNNTLDAEDFRYDRTMAEHLKSHALRYHTFLSKYYGVTEEEITRFSEEVIPDVISGMNELVNATNSESSLTGLAQAKDVLTRYPLLKIILVGESMTIGMDYY